LVKTILTQAAPLPQEVQNGQRVQHQQQDMERNYSGFTKGQSRKTSARSMGNP